VDVSQFMVILFIFILGFSFAFAILFPNPMGFEVDHLLGEHPMWEAWWGVVGNFNYLNLASRLGSIQPTTTVGPAMLFFYQFFVTIILVNLLIAMMSDTYGTTTAEGERHWLFKRSQLIREYLSRPPTPPPLNIAWLLFYDIPHYVYRRFLDTSSQHKIDLSGYKLVPTLKQVNRYQGVEAEARKTMLTMQEAEKREGQMAKLERLQGDLLRVEGVQRSNFENINGLFDDVNGKLAAITRALRAAGMADPSPPQSDEISLLGTLTERRCGSPSSTMVVTERGGVSAGESACAGHVGRSKVPSL